MKFLNTFFIGILFVLAPIFTLFVGLKNNYFAHYGVNEYFNAIFVDNVPFLWLVPLYFIFGYAMFYGPFRKIFRGFYALLLLACALSWYPKFGLLLGEKIFMSEPYEKDISVAKDGTHILNGRDVYVGRDKIYFLLDESDKVIKIPK
ncbi:hypothetical protein [Campylobacter curvus]|uniref:hypothetical protein n=1 Tax=Campylobacter curvus TaxID=200 RepID=UPI000367ED1D|nr:hypothetical protein [Campylobacter curvus]QKF60581.1 putative membrane protein [Campylobacter curvus]UEB50728.1 isoleucyl-tRNA synthetase [Campylobacter curvus]